MTTSTSPRPFVLRDLPFAARLTLAVFLISVGIGYLSALVQLHFQHAKTPGSLLPSGQNAVDIFHGQDGKPTSQIERLLVADDKGPWNGTGQMSAAFTYKSEGDWRKAIKNEAKAALRRNPGEPDLAAAEHALRQKRMTERDAVVAWIQAGASKENYKDDKFCTPPEWADRPIAAEFLATEDDKPVVPRAVKIKTILTQRCVRCHAPDGEDPKAAEYPLDTYERLKPYVTPQTSSAMSLTKLAQTTHVHLLGFSMLYGLTGLILAFSSYPRFVRVLLCPLPLVAQVVDISFWWLARLDEPWGPNFARAIVVSGGLVGAGLFLHLILSLWDLFSARGKLVLILLAGAAGFGAFVAKEKVVGPYLSQEGKPAVTAKE